jgi:hypothetical protein
MGCEGVHWIRLTRNRDPWQALVNAKMNIPVENLLSS